MRKLLSGLVTFSLGRGGLKCLPITCLTLERPGPDPAEIRGVVAVSLVGRLLSGEAEGCTVLRKNGAMMVGRRRHGSALAL